MTLRFLTKKTGLRRTSILLLLVVLVPLGFSTKFYHGPLQGWVNDGAGDILYPIFWFLLLLFLFPRLEAKKAAGGVFFFSSLIEITQLFHPLWLENWRRNFILRTILGSGFEWIDFVYYAVGSVLALMLARYLKFEGR